MSLPQVDKGDAHDFMLFFSPAGSLGKDETTSIFFI